MYEDTLTDCLGGPRLSWHGKHKSSDENNAAAHLFQPHLSFPPPPLTLFSHAKALGHSREEERRGQLFPGPDVAELWLTNERIEIASLLKRKRAAKSELIFNISPGRGGERRIEMETGIIQFFEKQR